MNEHQKATPQKRGSHFEQRVYLAIRKLEEIGFARELKLHDEVSDLDGNIRKVDLTFILRTLLVEILISIECKSRERSISLDEVDQIKTFKRELPERNIFWLVSEGKIGDHTREALKRAGISFYSIEELEIIIDDIYLKYKDANIESLRASAHMLSMMHPGAYARAARRLREAEVMMDTMVKGQLRINI